MKLQCNVVIVLKLDWLAALTVLIRKVTFLPDIIIDKSPDQPVRVISPPA